MYRQVSAYCWLGSCIVGDNKTENKKQNSVELDASLAPAEAEVGAVAKAEQIILNKFVSIQRKARAELDQIRVLVISFRKQ